MAYENVELHEDKHTDEYGDPRGINDGDVAECGECGRRWCYTCHPTPASRCPFEYDHEETDAPKVFRYMVTIEAETEAQALQVMAERIGPDEPYETDAEGNEYPDGFDYTIDWDRA